MIVSANGFFDIERGNSISDEMEPELIGSNELETIRIKQAFYIENK